mgnify:CR=1 FL=1
MITNSDLKKYDVDEMYKIYDRWAELAKKSYELDCKSLEFDEINHIVFAGMGGSGAIGDVFSALFSKTNIHVTNVKGYILPKTVDSKTLVVCTSVSGNTDETLNVLELARKLDCKLACFSSGGKMQEIATRNNIFYKKIPIVHSPRTSFMSYLYSILYMIKPLVPISKNEIYESLSALHDLSQKIKSSNMSSDNPSIELAEWIHLNPVIYFPSGLQSAAIRFKNCIQENVKMHTMIEDVVEACHNNIVSWEHNSNFSPILLRGSDDFFKTKERWEILKEYFTINKINFKEINSINGNILTKLVYMIYLLDYASIYLAIKNKTNPSTVKSIDFIKSRL